MMPQPTLVSHGINNTLADYWVHYFPLQSMVYWYRVDHVREYLRLKNIDETPGHSKDGTVSGSGYLIPRTAYFVTSTEVPEKFLRAFDWEKMTDREMGLHGEHVVEVLIEQRIMTLPIFRVRALRTASDQNNATDSSGRYFGTILFETKTERPKTNNLFVQSREGGHRPNLQSVNGEFTERPSELRSFESDF